MFRRASEISEPRRRRRRERFLFSFVCFFFFFYENTVFSNSVGNNAGTWSHNDDNLYRSRRRSDRRSE